MGAPSLIKETKGIIDPMLLAIEELERGVIPITVRRQMPEKKELGA
jgi:DNA-directed RNA polymerase subunit K/omega